MPQKKIKSYQDLYPTPGKEYGIATRHSENFGLNIPRVTLFASIPPLLITIIATVDSRVGLSTKTDIANHSILFILAYIMTGVIAVMALLGLRTALRTRVTNLGLLMALYIILFVPVCLLAANTIIMSGVSVVGMPPVVFAVVSEVIIMFVFTMIAALTNR